MAEQRVRFGVKANTKGICNMDVTVEAMKDPDIITQDSVVIVAGDLLVEAMKKFVEVVEAEGYQMAPLPEQVK